MKTTKAKKLSSISDFLGVIDYKGGLYEAFISHEIRLENYDIPDDVKIRLSDAVEDFEIASQELEAIVDELRELEAIEADEGEQGHLTFA